MNEHDSELMMDEDGEIHGELQETALTSLARGEYESQIATAKRYPRSIREFRREAKEMATLDQETAGECMYALKRGGKVIQGPSARLAEVLASAWGNCRAGARVIDEDGRFVTAQGMFIDLQRNVAIQYEVKRRITNSSGQTYNDDMIGVTANAACSIALRNAVLKGIPKAFWKPIYDAAVKCAIGEAKSLSQTRISMLEHFAKMGVSEQQVLTYLDVKGVEDIDMDKLALLRGTATALKDGETTIDEAFGGIPKAGGRVGKSSIDVSAKGNGGEKGDKLFETQASATEAGM